ncbi:MAG: hypothetical protein D6714_09220 [Bacteroidetes bacterium]|nr:MAG: hypothetical protein D6714_09220 [Bacteroidota bacterium]
MPGIKPVAGTQNQPNHSFFPKKPRATRLSPGGATSWQPSGGIRFFVGRFSGIFYLDETTRQRKPT